MKALFFIALLISTDIAKHRETQYLQAPPNQSRLRLAFGSCYNIFDKRNDIFDAVLAKEPNLWIWLGDAAYTDRTILSHCKRHTPP